MKEMSARERLSIALKHEVLETLTEEGMKNFRVDGNMRSTKVQFKDRRDAEFGKLLLEEEGMNVDMAGSKMIVVSHDLKEANIKQQRGSEVMKKEHVARELVTLAKSIIVAEEETFDELDEKFVSKLRTLRSQLSKISQKKRRKLGQLGIGVLRQTATVEDLVDALLVAANS